MQDYLILFETTKTSFDPTSDWLRKLESIAEQGSLANHNEISSRNNFVADSQVMQSGPFCF